MQSAGIRRFLLASLTTNMEMPYKMFEAVSG